MPTVQEIEKIKQAHMQSLLQGKARIEQLKAKVAAERIAATELLKSPFGTLKREPHVQSFAGQGITLSPIKSLQSTLVVEKTPDASGSNIFFAGVGFFLAVCVLLYVLLRRLWTDAP